MSPSLITNFDNKNFILNLKKRLEKSIFSEDPNRAEIFRLFSIINDLQKQLEKPIYSFAGPYEIEDEFSTKSKHTKKAQKRIFSIIVADHKNLGASLDENQLKKNIAMGKYDSYE